VDDIYLNVAEPGQAPERIALRDALGPEEEEDVLAPSDPDAPDVLPADPSTDPPVAPTDPDAPDTPPDPSDPGDVLAPTDPDATET
jgi:hypothetical protein